MSGAQDFEGSSRHGGRHRQQIGSRTDVDPVGKSLPVRGVVVAMVFRVTTHELRARCRGLINMNRVTSEVAFT